MRVIEVIPPAVDTDPGGPGLHTFGIPLDEVADHVMKCLERGKLEIPCGFSEKVSRASRSELEEILRKMNF